MDLVLTLVASNDALGAEQIDTARAVIEDLGGTVGRTSWLKENTAADLLFENATLNAVETKARAALPGLDLLAQDAEPLARKKHLLIADMDSTIIPVECLDELADFADLKPQIAEITERAMRGELDFEEALEERIGLLAAKGLGEDTLQRCFDERISLSDGAAVTVKTMRAHGAVTALVSGGFTFFTERVAELAGFEFNRANVLEFDGGTLNGVARPILGKEAKRETLIKLCTEAGLSPDHAIAIGDGANDLAMIETAGLGVAYRAKPVVADAARARIDHTDLTTLLYFQGYKVGEFAEG